MRVEKPGDLIFWTYYMVNWKETKQAPSDQRCVQCGGPMMKVGPIEAANSSRYDGLVCHACRRVIWATSS